MSKFFRFTGRLLFVLFFVFSGLQKVQNPEKGTKQLVDKYSALYQAVSELQNQTLYKEYIPEKATSLFNKNIPEWISPKQVNLDKQKIMFAVGVAELVCAFGILTTFSLFGMLAYKLLLSLTVLYHNPFLAKNKDEYTVSLEQGLLNIALLGGVLMMIWGFESGAKGVKSEQNNKEKKIQQQQQKVEQTKQPQKNKSQGKDGKVKKA